MHSQYEESTLVTIWNFLPTLIKFFSGLGLVAVVMVAINLFATQNEFASSYVFEEDLVRDYNPVIGNVDSQLTYVYFVDYQCPVCGDNISVMSQLKNDYKDKIRIVYKHNPLEIHSLAPRAARAVQAAARQDKAFELGDILLSRQSQGLSDDNLESWAKEVNMPDFDRWNRDRKSREIDNEVKWDQLDLNRVELPASSLLDKRSKPSGSGSGTPTSILVKDGKAVDWLPGRIDYPQLKAFVDAQLTDPA